jgi:hypothetical protein
LKRAFGHFHHAAFFIACAYAQMRRPAEALEWARYTAENGFPCYPLLASESALDPVRDDPSFAGFMTDMKRDWDGYRTMLFPPKTDAESAGKIVVYRNPGRSDLNFWARLADLLANSAQSRISPLGVQLYVFQVDHKESDAQFERVVRRFFFSLNETYTFGLCVKAVLARITDPSTYAQF